MLTHILRAWLEQKEQGHELSNAFSSGGVLRLSTDVVIVRRLKLNMGTKSAEEIMAVVLVHKTNDNGPRSQNFLSFEPTINIYVEASASKPHTAI